MLRTVKIEELGETRQFKKKDETISCATPVRISWIVGVYQGKPETMSLVGEILGNVDIERIRKAIAQREEVNVAIYIEALKTSKGTMFNNVRVYPPKEWREVQ